MLISLRIFLFLSSFVFLAFPARAFVDPPSFDPAQPVEMQDVTMSIRVGECHGFYAPPPGHDFMRVETSPGQIRITISGNEHTDPILCNAVTGTLVESIGDFDAGDYEVVIDMLRSVPPYDTIPAVARGRLSVSARAAATTVPATGIAVLIGLGLGLVFVSLKGSRLGLLGVALGVSGLIFMPDAYAKQEKVVLVEISADPLAPSPEVLVDQYDFSGGLPPPLDSLRVGSPNKLSYFIPDGFRAQGDFLDYLKDNPEIPRSILERTIIVHYPDDADIDQVMAAFGGDPYVRHASLPLPIHVANSGVDRASMGLEPLSMGELATQYWKDAMNFPSAWGKAGGWSLVGVVDTGLAVNHPDLRSLDEYGALTGGNHLAGLSVDIGRRTRRGEVRPGEVDYNVDEMEPVAVRLPMENACDHDQDGFMVPVWAGHGTHVHGLIAANHANSSSVVGACKNCGMASIRFSQDQCNVASQTVEPQFNGVALYLGIEMLVASGAQVINLSLGGDYGDQNYCQTDPRRTACVVLAYAQSFGVVMVGASGNHRRSLQFPASDPRVISVGGLDESLTFWDESPGSTLGCPYDNDKECGSNYTKNISLDAKQELVAPARRVLSTTYPGRDWNPVLNCGDSLLGTSGNGLGPCSGTSMSAPIISGLVGILRSINPLVLPGEATFNPPQKIGIRNVLIWSAILPYSNIDWHPNYGYGRVNADLAVSSMLGVSRGVAVKSRLTPLFSFYGTKAKDWAYTTSPQAARAFFNNYSGGYQPLGFPTPGYSGYPYMSPEPRPPEPRAAAYVLTTEFKPHSNYPNLKPLYWLDRVRTWPAGCTPGIIGCNADNRDFLLMSNAADVWVAVNSGYTYRGIQGYIYSSCTPEPACIPPGAEKLWRMCKASDDDCAVFLERERFTFQQRGYVTVWPSTSAALLGYAYPAVDSDGDGLVNGFEHILGTRVMSRDSDQDGVPDGVEYPQDGVPISDPCSSNRCESGFLFEDGFEEL